MSRPAVGPVLIMVAIAAIVAAIGAGMLVIGFPSEARERRADRRRVEDLRQLAGAVDVFWTRHQRLPDTAEQLREEGLVRQGLQDPESGAPYSYRAIDGKVFELCAEFRGASADDEPARAGSFWSHGAGRQCFRPEAKSADR